MFRKTKDGEGTAGDDNERPPMKPFSARGTHGSAKPPSKPPAISTAAAKRAPEFQGPPHRLDRPPQGDSKTLVVGRDISLSGDIGECERLIVEGQVEVTLSGARLIEVLPSGLFKGACETVNAEISGRFEPLNNSAIFKISVLLPRAGTVYPGKSIFGSRLLPLKGAEVISLGRSIKTGPGRPVLVI